MALFKVTMPYQQYSTKEFLDLLVNPLNNPYVLNSQWSGSYFTMPGECCFGGNENYFIVPSVKGIGLLGLLPACASIRQYLDDCDKDDGAFVLQITSTEQDEADIYGYINIYTPASTCIHMMLDHYGNEKAVIETPKSALDTIAYSDKNQFQYFKQMILFLCRELYPMYCIGPTYQEYVTKMNEYVLHYLTPDHYALFMNAFLENGIIYAE